MRFNQLSTWISVLYLLCIQASAHFMLNYPTSLGFVDEKEGTAPCGGFDVTFNNASDFHVDGDAVALTSTHPQADWLFRATLDKNATGNNWTDLLPPVSESGLGQYCEPSLAVPSQWAGNTGIIQVLQHGDDGLLFQVKEHLNPFPHILHTREIVWADPRMYTVCSGQFRRRQSHRPSIDL